MGFSYTYGPDGNRVRKDANGTATEYIFFGGNVIAEKNITSGAWTDYIFGYGKRIAKDTSTNGTAAQYYQDDHLGTTRIMTDAAGNKIMDCSFNAFGEQISCSPDHASNHYRYAGKERDTESGLDDFGARYYSSTMGRWTTPDWSGTPSAVPYAELGNPQSLNLYAYVENNPGIRIDADGHCWSWLQGACNLAQKLYHGVFTDCGFKTNAQVAKINEEDRQWLIQHNVVTPDKNGNTIDWKKASPSQVRATYSAVVGQMILRLIHGPETLSGAAMDSVRKMSTEEIINSLKQGDQPAIVKPDGTVMNGNTRLAVLRERGVDINKLGLKPDPMYEEFNVRMAGAAAEPSVGEESTGSEEPIGSTNADPEEPPL